MTDLTLSQFASKDDLLAAQAARIAELESQLDAIGAGGVEPLRKPVAAPQAVQAAVPEGWKLAPIKVPDSAFAWVSGGYPAGFKAWDKRDTAVVHERAQRAWEAILNGITAPAHPGMDAAKLLAEKHTGMKVDYRGLLGQVRRAIKRTAGGHEEMLRQLEGHITELGQRWYAGDTDVVDELLQLYCVEREARAALAAQAKQGGASNG